jgi:nitrogen fixation/metabolism regulation signal transduction histidine kinase
LVLEADVRLLANPLVIRMGLGLLVSMAVFVAGILIIRALRRELVENESLPEPLGSPEDATYAYSAVIQKLKQQKFELQNEHAAQQRRAKTSEQITAAVIANLPCGILFVGPNGLVKQANAAARQLLGFASPLGMSPDAIFRNTTVDSGNSEPVRLADEITASLRNRFRASFHTNYETASGEHRSLAFTLIPLTMDEASALACVIDDETGVAQARREKLLQSEFMAEMALQLRSSFSVIRDCADRLKKTGQQSEAHLAGDIAAETDRMEKLVSEFVAEHSLEKAAAVHA